MSYFNVNIRSKFTLWNYWNFNRMDSLGSWYTNADEEEEKRKIELGILGKIKNWIDEFYYLFILQIILFIATGIDFIVHDTLYSYGLQFDYAWANPYWILLFLLFVFISLVGATAYYIDREKVYKPKLLLVFITLLGEYVGGFLDSIWFLMSKVVTGSWGNAFGNWTWHSYSLIGFYNLNSNILINIIVGIILVLTWIFVLHKES